MRIALNDLLETKVKIPILDDIYLTENGLTYHALHYTTNEKNPIEYIGLKAREEAKKNKINDLEKQKTNIQETLNILKETQRTIQQNKKRIPVVPNENKVWSIKELLNKSETDLKRLNLEKESLESKIAELSNVTFTNEVLKDYSIDELRELRYNYHNFLNKKETNEAQLKNILPILSDIATTLIQNESKKKGLEEKGVSLDAEREKLLQEIEQLENDETYFKYKEENQSIKQKLTVCENEIRNTEDQLLILSENFRNENKKKDELDAKLNETRRIYNSTNQIIKDAFSKVEKYQDPNLKSKSKNDRNQELENNKLELKYERISTQLIPKSAHSDVLKELLPNLIELYIIDKRDGTSMPISKKMENIQNEIDEIGDIKKNLYNSAEIILKNNLFSEICNVHDEVYDNLNNLKKCMEIENPSMLKLFVDFELSGKHQNKKELFNDLLAQDKAIEDLNDEIRKVIEENDFDIAEEEIKELLLEELDPLNWYDLSFHYENNESGRQPLTTNAISSFSNGERARAYYIPMLSLLEIIHKQTKHDAPKILIIDEAFSAIDPEQTEYILYKIHDISDLFIATIPTGNSIELASNSTRFDVFKINKKSFKGKVCTSCIPGTEYEEFEDEEYEEL